MSIYARIELGSIVEIIQPIEVDGVEVSLADRFAAAFVATCIDITNIVPRPSVGWSAVDNAGAWTFGEPAANPAPTVQELQATVDAAAMSVYDAIGSSSPGLLAEYKQANEDAMNYKAAGYSGSVPETVQCWATASGMTAQEAADNILSTAAAWMTVLNGVRSARLIGKANVYAAATPAAQQAAATTAINNILAFASQA